MFSFFAFLKSFSVDAGSLFQSGVVLGKKQYMKQSGKMEVCLNVFEWLALVFVMACIRYKSLFMFTMLFAHL